jgi:lysyl-tRNA synthetase class 2
MSSAGNDDEQGSTQEKISKNELKRQMKAQKKADEKSQKATPVPSAKKEETTAAAGGGENDDQELDPNEYYKMRLHHVQTLKQAGETVYPHKYHVSISLRDFIDKYSHL